MFYKLFFPGLLSISLLSTTPLALAASPGFPAIVAHRGGTADAPENTIYAIKNALQNSADAIWVTVQLSSDGVPVLYRPTDLKTLTNGSGPISSFSAFQLGKLDAAYYFDPKDGYPLRGRGIGIPTLESVLKEFPNTFFYLDIKSPDADPNKMAANLKQILENTGALQRIRIYSTEAKYTEAAQAMPHFETRDETRTALANVTMAHSCQLSPKLGSWYGYELRRDVQLTETTTLGVSPPSASQLVWNREAANCFIGTAKGNVLLIGINSADDYATAAALGSVAVLVDSPAQARQWPSTIIQSQSGHAVQ
ncbi:glycerophosphodiester phosphodiesterase family protein [Burkholderia ubonensis]|uniref:glycerophosphodiester phosphodiesterase family protein n=1 Tax=Burkholderia ubonensis TaxID=101571 RepID=UPI0009B4010B|nr:glycerophosphodiester phosphodiesterase family protein [Burkholderia ubonensis]